MTSIISYVIPGLVLLGIGYAAGSFRIGEPAYSLFKIPAIMALAAIALIGFLLGTFGWLMAALVATPLFLGMVLGLVITLLKKDKDDCGCPNNKTEEK